MPKHSSHKLRCKPDAFGPRTGIPAVRAMIMISAALCLLTAPGLCARASTGGQVPDGLETDRAVTLSLYFADPARFALLAEQRQLPRPENPLALGRAIIGELVAGPYNKHLVRTLPDGAILRALFIDADKTAYVDLDNTMWARHPGSVQSDILAVYSIVNSLVLNMAEIDTVKILSRGREPIPAAGHLDLRYPFKANILLIR
jgi:hypothetical protein